MRSQVGYAKLRLSRSEFSTFIEEEDSDEDDEKDDGIGTSGSKRRQPRARSSGRNLFFFV